MFPWCSGYWYYLQFPQAAKDLFTIGAVTRQLAGNPVLPWALTGGLAVIALIGGIALYTQPKRAPLAVALLLLVGCMGLLAEFERVREFVRKPYIIYGYMYANGVRVMDVPVLNRDGFAIAALLVWNQFSIIRGVGGHTVADVPRFSLIDHHGRAVAEADFPGKFLLIYFGYTYCPDVCPTTLSVMAEALDQLGPDAGKVVPILITIDPARDTPSVLADYVAAFSPNMIGLTGSPEQIRAAAQQFGVIYARNRSGDDYTMDHSALIYLLGPDGRRLNSIAHGTSAEALAVLMKDRLR